MRPSIPEYYEGKQVLLTGATGLVGKSLLAKLLMICSNVGKIYLIVRPKKGVAVEERIKEILNCQVFDRLNERGTSREELLSKLVLITGHITQPNLGLSAEDMEILLKNVNIVIHCAASINFNLPIQINLKINVGGTKNLLELAVAMPKLQAFVYVSTSFCNRANMIIEEFVYPTQMEPEKFLNIFDALPPECCEALTPFVLKGLPNTYSFTKQISERLVESYSSKLPICITRPGAIIASYLEPYPGWNEASSSMSKFYGRVFGGDYFPALFNSDVRIAFVPLDYAVNLIIAIAWKLGSSKTPEFLVYNNAFNALPCKDFFSIGSKAVRESSFKGLIWYPKVSLVVNHRVYWLGNTLFRFIPSYLSDLVSGKKNGTGLVQIYQESQKLVAAFEPYSLNEWVAGPSHNTKRLKEELRDGDRETFPIDLEEIDWTLFTQRFARGIHLYGPNRGERASPSRMFRLQAFEAGMKLLGILTLLLPVLAVFLMGCQFA